MTDLGICTDYLKQYNHYNIYSPHLSNHMKKKADMKVLAHRYTHLHGSVSHHMFLPKNHSLFDNSDNHLMPYFRDEQMQKKYKIKMLSAAISRDRKIVLLSILPGKEHIVFLIFKRSNILYLQITDSAAEEIKSVSKVGLPSLLSSSRILS